MASRDDSKKKSYTILFALLVLFTFVALYDQTSPTGEFYKTGSFPETWELSCNEAAMVNPTNPVGQLLGDFGKQFTVERDCADACRRVAFNQQPFVAGSLLVTAVFTDCSLEQQQAFNTGCPYSC